MTTFAAGDTDYIAKLNELAAAILDATAAYKLHIGDLAPSGFVVSGGIPPTSASLASTITAAVAYVLGGTGVIRVSKDATAKTFTASKDTYVDLGADGTYTYSEVANGAGAPSVAANSIRMCKVVTNGSSVTSVTDLRDLGYRERRQQASYYLDLLTATLTANRAITWPDASGTVALTSSAPFRNRYANGDFSVDQYNEGAAYTFSASSGHALDGVYCSAAGAGTFTAQRVADPDNANLYCLKLACTVADASIGATDRYYAGMPIEGFDVADLNAGLATAEKITISFKMNSSVAGTYGISVANAAGNRVYVGTVTQDVAATEESKTVTLTLDTTGTWQTTTGVGLRVRLCLAAGSNYQGTAGAWGASDIFTTSAQANFMSANTNVLYLKQLQVEKGAAATAFDFRSIDERYRRLKRYLRKSFEVGTAIAQNGGEGGSIEYKAQVAGTTAGYELVVPFDVPMRISPTIVTYSPSAASATWYNRNGGANSGTPTTLGRFHSVLLINPQAAGDNAGDRIQLHYSADARMTA